MIAARAQKLVPLVTSLVLACLVCSCAHTTTVGSDRLLTVALSDYRLNPQDARVSAGMLTILVRNYGRLTHNLVLTLKGQPAAKTRPIPPGESVAITVSLARGSYLMASTIVSDQALGEYGTLTVT